MKSKPSEICQAITHRPFPLPEGNWQFYQEWNDALFLHFEVDLAHLKTCLPHTLKIDTFEGKAYVSIVAFKMQNIRPRRLPALAFLSNFHEINVRTYVIKNDKPGVYFLNIEAAKWLSTLVSKTLSGLPYTFSSITRNKVGYFNINTHFKLNASFEKGKPITAKSNLDIWLTERYCLYVYKNNRCYRYTIHHLEWELHQVNMLHFSHNYTFGKQPLSNSYHSAHYSEGIQVISWPKEKNVIL